MCDNLTKENAVSILNTIFAEIYVSVDIWYEYMNTFNNKTKEIYDCKNVIDYRLSITLTSVVLSCNKIIEFNKKYSKLMHKLTPELNLNRKRLVTEINNRNIPSFRNDIVGHIHCKSLKRPLTSEEYHKRFEELTGGKINLYSFFKWLRPLEPNKISLSYSVCGEIKKCKKLW